METDKERKVFIIKERRKMIGWEHKTDGEEKSTREWLIMESNETKGPVQTMAAMVTSPPYTLIGEYKMEDRKSFIKAPLYKRLIKAQCWNAISDSNVNFYSFFCF